MLTLLSAFRSFPIEFSVKWPGLARLLDAIGIPGDGINLRGAFRKDLKRDWMGFVHFRMFWGDVRF